MSLLFCYIPIQGGNYSNSNSTVFLQNLTRGCCHFLEGKKKKREKLFTVYFYKVILFHMEKVTTLCLTFKHNREIVWP